MSRVLGVIPARFASTRFPGKPLAPLAAGTLLERVWRRAASATRPLRWIVATDDERIADAARSFGAETMLTSADHRSGTDRVAEVVARSGDGYDVVLNVQGDEPLVTGTSLDRLAAAMSGRTSGIATLAEPIDSTVALFDPNVVKVVTARDGRALYFSRSPVPYWRGDGGMPGADFSSLLDAAALARYRKHQGIYAYARTTLLELGRSGPSPLESAEGLEQLRALEAGHAIYVIDSDFRSIGVDTPADLARAAERIGRDEPARPGTSHPEAEEGAHA